MKFKIFLLSIFSLYSYDISAQNKDSEFTLCNDIKYSVDDFQLKQKYGELSQPTINSKFIGGIDELKKYFAENSLTNSKSKDIVFRTHIGFIVNCEGKAGNFEITSNGKGDLQILSEDILKIVKAMPQHWEPAEINGLKVDSYQILSFTIVDGNLTKINYR